MNVDWLEADATALAAAVRKRQVSPAELVEQAIAAIEQSNPRLNAVVIPLFDKAREAARGPIPEGPFAGVPFLVKDLICQTAGDPYHAGSRFLRRHNYRAPADTYLAQKFRTAGLIIVGRTNVPEFGPVPTTEPELYGPTRNPWNGEYSPGGSSGGSAAAVAARLVPMAHGNDGGGSIRIPASATGLFGLKPSRGRVSLGPQFGDLWDGAVAEHVLTRSVRDSALLLDWTAGPMPGDPHVAPMPDEPFHKAVERPPRRLRIGWVAHVPSGWSVVAPECRAALEKTARLLEELGHHVEEAFPPALSEAELQQHFGTTVMASVAWELEFWSRVVGAPIEPEDLELHTWQLARAGREVTAVEWLKAHAWLQGFTRRVLQWWADGFDLLLTPTMAQLPPRLGELRATPEEPMRAFTRSIPLVAFTAPFNVTGQPAASLPLHWTEEGLPVGVQLVAAYGREDILFSVCGELERAQPWLARKPPLMAS